MSDKLTVAQVKINEVFQTEIDDDDADKLCLWMCNVLAAWSILCVKARMDKRAVPAPLTLDDFNRLKNICLSNGALAKRDAKNSFNGFVTNHEKCAEAVGLLGYEKQYVKFSKDKKGVFDVGDVINLLSWGALVELRDEGAHSLIATGWYKADGKFYLEVRDPWPKTNDTRFDCARGVTQRYVKGAWVDSRTIEFYGWFFKRGTSPKWIV
jgi:hypothetical protein